MMVMMLMMVSPSARQFTRRQLDMHLIGGAAERIRNEIAKKEKKKAKK